MTHDDYVDTNRPTAKGADRYGYDGWGKQASTTWDGLERLQSLFERTTPSYTYSGDGLRVKSVVGSTTTNFAWDLGQSVPQLLSDGNDHIWGPTGLLAVQSGTCTTYAFNEGLGSVQATKTSTMASTTKQYDAFGKPLPAPPDPCTPLRIGFAGEQRDGETRLTYLRARYMDPATGRFLSKDPEAGTAGQPATQHGYTYAGNNPVRYTDPSGRRWDLPGSQACGGSSFNGPDDVCGKVPNVGCPTPLDCVDYNDEDPIGAAAEEERWWRRAHLDLDAQSLSECLGLAYGGPAGESEIWAQSYLSCYGSVTSMQQQIFILRCRGGEWLGNCMRPVRFATGSGCNLFSPGGFGAQAWEQTGLQFDGPDVTKFGCA